MIDSAYLKGGEFQWHNTHTIQKVNSVMIRVSQEHAQSAVENHTVPTKFLVKLNARIVVIRSKSLHLLGA